MSPGPDGLRARLVRRLGRLSIPALAILGVLIVAGVGASGYYAYRTYDFVEHDNEFCLSCHLMVDPYERFAASPHRELGCKDCHQPSLIERSRMGLTQVVDNPDELTVHAEVPNERCASCHIDGDPERWSSVAATAGHRVHLESDDPALEGLQCVECHSSSLHEFAATDRTCAQSGCHTDSDVELGAMSDLTIHCAACHGFSAPVEGDAGQDVALAELAPDAGTCLSCHAMQAAARMPADDPHEGACASCHNPHEQRTPAEAAETCATSGCHTDPAALTAFHRGLDPGVAQDCLYCHQAHGFRVDGSNCLACHQDVFEEEPAGAPSEARGAARIPGAHPVAHASGVLPTHAAPAVHVASVSPATPSSALHAVASDAVPVHAVPLPTAVLVPSTRALQERPPFLHAQHRDQACAECHETVEEHGLTTVTTVSDCRSCHHVAPVADDCTTCHAAPGPAAPDEVERLLSFSVSTSPERRSLPFAHSDHAGESCGSCHADGIDRSAAEADCASCHAPHHEPSADCAGCHLPAEPGAHELATAHVGCAGAACHQDLPFERVERSRSVCLVCHQDMVDHRPEGDCAECHAMTGPAFGSLPP